ncbi:sugar ABC transporter permease [Deinococcus sp. KNUC1210]|uniref:carbohydrate ABC transporter permease n=1 Tax=Deinococcus sp. KNUC1210 TaxID=2917691 RepID=UPI001EF03FD8|nr:sugar ABC transporter permease [Deinococcus sp. KNUC1210]ULH14331.1 sugar ABC transporter permease [Deinococcus sp. KNUC1210]
MNQKGQTATAYLFLTPFLVVLAVFFCFAFLRTIYYSFTDFNLFDPPKLIGLKPYTDVLGDSSFRRALANSLLFAVITTTLQTVLSLLMAVALNRKIRGLSFFRAAWYMPSITSSVVITLIFLWLFQQQGVINYLITQLQSVWPLILTFALILIAVQVIQVLWEKSRKLPVGSFDPALLAASALIALFVTWGLSAAGVVTAHEVVDTVSRPGQITPFLYQYFADKWLSIGGVQIISVPLMVIIFMNTFTTIPTLMLFFLAGLQNIPTALYEATEIDGATPFQQLINVTVPMLRPVSFYVITVGLIGTLQMFDQVAVIGNAAPTDTLITLAYYVYANTFKSGVAPVYMASAAAIILAIITLLLVTVQRRFISPDAV